MSGSRLGYLMKMLDISGKELSQALKIDTTTISKWRNDQRRLTYHSRYTRDLARYFLKKDAESQAAPGRIAGFLKNYIPGLNCDSENQMVDALSLWLTQISAAPPDEANRNAARPIRNGYTAPAAIYTGAAGVEEAIARFLEYTLTFPPGREVLFADYRDIDFAAERVDAGRMARLFIGAAQHGHTVRIIDCATDIFRPYLAVYRWLPMYLSENVEVWRHQDFTRREVRMSTFVLPGEMILNCYAIDSLPGAHHSMLFQDRQTVDFMEASVRGILSNSKKMIETVESADVLSMLRVLDENLKSMQLTFMLNPVPTFRNMPPDLLREILRENAVDGETARVCLEANRQTRAIRDRCRYLQIYDLDALEARVLADTIVDYDLSAICREQIVVSKACFKKHLEFLLGIRNTENYSMVLASFRELDLIAPTVSIIAQDDSLVVAWDAGRYPRRMYCRDLVMVNGFYAYLEQTWKSIPPICKSDAWREKQFRRMIQMLG